VDDDLPMIAAAGLDFEAEAARGLGVKVVRGLNRRRFLRELHAQATRGARGIISFGVAGGLSPKLETGDVVVASAVHTAEGIFRTCEAWSASLLAALPHARYLPVFGAMGPVLTPLEKEALWNETGSATVDVESRDAAEVAAHYGMPYAVVRIVLDPADREIPLSALSGVDDAGNTCAKSLFKALAQRPQDIPGMLRIAAEGRKATQSLLRTRQALGPCFSFYGPVVQLSCTEAPQDASYSGQNGAASSYFVFIRTWLARRNVIPDGTN